MAILKGGEKLRAYLEGLADRVGRGGVVQVGFLENATYPDGTSVAMVAAVNDFGHGDTPSRPFFRNMIALNSDSWGPVVGKMLKQTNYDVSATLSFAGDMVKGELQESILDLWAPPLAASTVKKKGFDKPLIDKSHMINSADYKVFIR